MSEEWEYSANNLLTHFRTVTLGYQPFTVGWEKLALTPGFESLDIESRRYLINVRKLLEQRHCKLLRIPDSAYLLRSHQHISWRYEGVRRTTSNL